ncbi:hypothetical protein BAU14_06200 [Enterococcus sp. CU9D]|nr:hypothetical protein BAU14_06200 [Enterococcus sp. CU9D]
MLGLKQPINTRRMTELPGSVSDVVETAISKKNAKIGCRENFVAQTADLLDNMFREKGSDPF